MILKDKDDKLIRIYFLICNYFKELQYCCERFSNNNQPEVTDKGFCSTKGTYYHGMKLHMLGFRREGKLPHPEENLFIPASVNDITVYKQAWPSIENRTFFEDKIYMDRGLDQQMIIKQNSEMYTPIKGVKGMADIIKKRLKAVDDLFSVAVSRVRQSIEAIFNWLIEKVDIQRANKVLSTKGLMVHAFDRLTAAFITFVI